MLINVETIICWWNDKDILGIVQVEELWLQGERLFKINHSLNFLSFPIKSEHLFLPRKNDCIPLETILIFEVEIHTNFFEHIVIFDNYSFFQGKLFIILYLKYEHLLDPLLSSDQIISCDDCDILLILALLNSQYLVELSLTLLRRK